MYEERVLLGNDLQLRISFATQEKWSLVLKRGKRILVEYKPAKGYEFTSVEKLRYDFERDAESAQRKDR